MFRSLVTAGCLALTAATAAAQQSPNEAAAIALFDDAVALRKSGDHAAACARFRESQRLSPARGTLLNIAECFEREGKRASAWATYSALMDQAEAAGDRERLAIARRKREELATGLARLTIVGPSGVDGLTIRRNGAVVPPGIWDTPVPVDAGQQVVEATATGFQRWTGAIEIADGQERRLEVPALRPVPAPPEAAPPARPPEVGNPAPPMVAVGEGEPGGSSARRPVGLATAAAGGAAIAVGLGFGLHARGKRNDADPYCTDELVCDPPGIALVERAQRSARIANLLVGAGAVVTVGGLLLWWTAPGDSGLQVGPTVGAAGAGVSVRGDF